MPDKDKKTFSLKDVVMIIGAVGALIFHAGTFYAVKDQVKKNTDDIRLLQQENNRQQIDIEIMQLRIAKNDKR